VKMFNRNGVDVGVLDRLLNYEWWPWAAIEGLENQAKISVSAKISGNFEHFASSLD